ncbi:MAG: FkbM family methyltransferase [Anaeromyxobacteraceae bacterium]
MTASKVFVLPSGVKLIAAVEAEDASGWTLSAPMELGAGDHEGLTPFLPHALVDRFVLRRELVLAAYEPGPPLRDRHLEAGWKFSATAGARLAGAAAAPGAAPSPPVLPPPGKNRAEGDVDRLVHEHFFAGRSYRGVFVDVGAARPDFLSVSALYRGLGWRVLALEPNPEFAELQRRAGSEVLQYACGARDEDDVEFTLVNQHGQAYEGGKVSYESFSSLGIKPEYAALKSDLDKRHIRVKLRRLDTVLRQHAPEVRDPDILSVDVEGWEMEVLDGLDLARNRPRVMVIENLFKSQAYVDRLARDGYVLWRRLEPNDVYVDRALVGA